ncbi:hypothetical protein GpartN1_g2059.t1 [Galdieria partita]|uniref:Uncharacterized protein n=1 Tax=Galdieria partita TaxID=83374 RepID=A0A9C7UNX5_9RHOD|nr:hypothetical protein GpartN1_g2059.t1 [Galdieria partita]
MPPARPKRLLLQDNLQKENIDVTNSTTQVPMWSLGSGKLVNIGRLPDDVDLLAFQDICPFTGTTVTYTPGYEFLRELQGRKLLCTVQQDSSGRPKFQVKETNRLQSEQAIDEQGYYIHELWNRIIKNLNNKQNTPINGLEAHGLLSDETRSSLSSLLEGEQTQISLSVRVKGHKLAKDPLDSQSSSSTTPTASNETKEAMMKNVGTLESDSKPPSLMSDDTCVPESLQSTSNASTKSNTVRTKEAVKRSTIKTSKKVNNKASQIDESSANERRKREIKDKRKAEQKEKSKCGTSRQSSNSIEHVGEDLYKSLEEDLTSEQGQTESYATAIEWIDDNHPLELYEKPLHHYGNLYCLSFNDDGSLLVSGSSTGTLCVWDTSKWERIGEFCDWETFDKELIEYLTCCFSPDSRYIIAAGVTRDRFSWNDEEDENSVIPGAIRIFDVTNGRVTARLEGHQEEVFCLKVVKREENFYLISCGEDGRICKFLFHCPDESHNQFDFSNACKVSTISVEAMINDSEIDPLECESFIAIDLQFLPRTNNRLFLVAVDSGLQLFDFDREICIAKFPNLYTAYADSISILPVDCSLVEDSAASQNDENVYSWYLVTRGVEWLDSQGNLPRGNCCTLRRLSCISLSEALWSLESIRDFGSEDYYSNIWPCRLATQGRYVVSGTTAGETFVWHLSSGSLTAKLRGFDASKTIRTILFHPTRALLVTAGDDEYIQIWQQENW